MPFFGFVWHLLRNKYKFICLSYAFSKKFASLKLIMRQKINFLLVLVIWNFSCKEIIKVFPPVT